MPKLKYKISYGVALCRYNKEKNNQFEILYIKKRYTYHFFNFVLGYYKKYNNNQLQYLFDNMTFGEKIDILSMKFSNMWYRLWMTDPEKKYNMYNSLCSLEHIKNIESQNDYHISNVKNYFRKKNKFESIFTRDGGKRLKKLINKSTNAVTPWEIPKGKKKEEESDLKCAMREFEEETAIPSDKYRVLAQVGTIRHSFKDDDTVYTSIYYCAILVTDWVPRIRFDTYSQVSEIEEVRWVALDELRFLNLNYKTHSNLINLFKCIKAKIKPYYKNI